MNVRLQEIIQKNAEFEKESPYNFCDRWCERCIHEKQVRCILYKDELERKITCIAYGREDDDPQITEAVLEAQYKDIEKKLSKCIDKFGVDLDDPDATDIDEEDEIDFEDLPEDIQKHIKFVENNSLTKTAEQYRKKVYLFLEKNFYENKSLDLNLVYDFQTVSWYHTLLGAKLHRALCGFHEPACEGDFALYDAIAQFQVCKKAIILSIEALRKIDTYFKICHMQITELITLLHNIHSRIVAMEESI